MAQHQCAGCWQAEPIEAYLDRDSVEPQNGCLQMRQCAVVARQGTIARWGATTGWLRGGATASMRSTGGLSLTPHRWCALTEGSPEHHHGRDAHQNPHPAEPMPSAHKTIIPRGRRCVADFEYLSEENKSSFLGG